MNHIRSIIILISILAFAGNSEAQQNRLIQFSGIVVSTDSADTPVPFASVFNRGIRMGSVANYQGFFSFAARVGDTIEISSVGYKKGNNNSS